MGRRRAKSAVSILAVAMALLAAAPAVGAPPDTKANGFDAFVLKGSNGYRLFVYAFFRPGFGGSSDLAVVASRGGRGAFYQAPAVVTDKKVEADLGSLGEIDVTFRPSGKKGVARPRCNPKRSLEYDKGTYVGTIDFRGEGGFTEVSADRARFSYGPFRDLGCPFSATGEAFGPDLPGARLRAMAKTGSGNLVLQANQNRPGERVRIEAILGEERGEIAVVREATLAYPASSFRFAPDLRTAVLDPPAPFSGAGFFRRGAKAAGRWSGNLRVDFPGRPDVRLTGARFDATLRHARLTKETFTPSRLNLSAWPLGSS